MAWALYVTDSGQQGRPTQHRPAREVNLIFTTPLGHPESPVHCPARQSRTSPVQSGHP